MFAKGLAKEAGLDYAILTGGDIAPLGKDAVTEIHKIFDWAKTSKKGVVIFVDEADAFLRKRSTEKISEDLRNALNAFLYCTGEATNKFLLVLASNQPEQFDWAINDRLDEMIEFKLPGYDERVKMIAMYMEKYILKPPLGSKTIIIENPDEVLALIPKLAEDTAGYSGREISKLAIAWQAGAYGSSDTKVTKEMLMRVLQENQSTKNMKKLWYSANEANNLARDS
jgi:ATPase family AAA domain-containing protein 3A/B